MSAQGFKSEHWNDASGNPAGGASFGTGFTISWQNGPLGRCECPADHLAQWGHRDDCQRKEPNGAFVEDVIAACADRILYYQNSRFFCEENATAVVKLSEALAALNDRTEKREARAVEGTHTA